MLVLALLSTTLLALCAGGVLVHLAKQWWPNNTKTRHTAQAISALLLAGAVFLHPVANRFFFQKTADQRLERIQNSLGKSIEQLTSEVGPSALADQPAFGQIHRFYLAPWYLLWPKHKQVDVLVVGGKVIQVGATHHLSLEEQGFTIPDSDAIPPDTDSLQPPASP